MTDDAAPAARKPAPRARKPSPPDAVPADTTAKTPAGTAPAAAETKLRRNGLVDRVVAQSGAKRGDVARIVEATLSVLGEALSNREQLVLPPFGNVRVKKSTVKDNGSAMTLSLRRSGKEPKAPKEPKALKQSKAKKAGKPQKAARTGKQALAVPAEAD